MQRGRSALCGRHEINKREKKTRNENERRGKQRYGRQRGKVRSDGSVCDAGEQARLYVCMYL